MVDKTRIQQEMVDKWSIKPTLAGKLADIIEFMADKEEIKTESNVYRRYPSVSSTTAKCVPFGTRHYPNGGFQFAMAAYLPANASTSRGFTSLTLTLPMKKLLLTNTRVNSGK